VRLLALPMSDEIAETLQLIVSICRYGHDVRSTAERERTDKCREEE
jgi:hypothetical protein